MGSPLFLATVLLTPSAGGAQNFGGVRPEERYFRYRAARHVSLLIEGLDGSGRAVSKTVAWVNGDVPAEGRRYFEAQAPPPGMTFRTTVLYYDWVPGDTR